MKAAGGKEMRLLKEKYYKMLGVFLFGEAKLNFFPFPARHREGFLLCE